MTDDEVNSLRQLNKNVYDSLVNIGDVEAAIARLTTQKKSLLLTHESLRSELQNTQKGLADKYGEKKVDLNTGELT